MNWIKKRQPNLEWFNKFNYRQWNVQIWFNNNMGDGNNNDDDNEY